MKRGYIVFILIVGIVVGLFLRDLLGEEEAAAKLVNVQSRNLIYQIDTTAETWDEFLTEQGFFAYQNQHVTLEGKSPIGSQGDSIEPSALQNDKEDKLSAEQISHGSTVRVTKQVKVNIIDGGSFSTVTSTAERVEGLFAEQGIALAPTDQVFVILEGVQRPIGSQGDSLTAFQNDIDYFLADGMTVEIDRIVDLEITETNSLPFNTVRQNDPNMYYGKEQVVQEGQAGKIRQEFMITYENGVETNRRLLGEEVIQQPVDKVISFGTKIEIQEYGRGRASWYATKGCMPAPPHVAGCAAHPHYEFGRYVRVTNENTGKSIIVRINDRGPNQNIHPDRIIDLDAVAYEKLAPLGSGTFPVRVELLRN